jgi:hypothetical protein
MSIRKIVDKCLGDSVKMIGVAGPDEELVQRIGADGRMNGVKLRTLSEGDVILLDPQCIDQVSGENIDSFGVPTYVLNVHQIGKEFFVLTDVGLVTDADLTYQIELALEGKECSMQEFRDLEPDYKEEETLDDFELAY